MDCSTPGLPVHHQLLELGSNSCPLSWWCHPTISSSRSLLLLPSIFPSIRVFSKESVLCIIWPKYWRFSFSISPSNEYSGLICFRIEKITDLFTYILNRTRNHFPTLVNIYRLYQLEIKKNQNIATLSNLIMSPLSPRQPPFTIFITTCLLLSLHPALSDEPRLQGKQLN